MKKLLIFVLFLTISIIACDKEEITSTETVIGSSKPILNDEDPENIYVFRELVPDNNRSGVKQEVFYPGSVSRDNYLIPGKPRTQYAYNKLKIDSVKMIRVGTGAYSIQYTTPNGTGGVNQPIVTMWAYNVHIKYKGEPNYTVDDSIYFSKAVGNLYVYKPVGENLVFSANPNKFVKLVRNTSEYQVFYDWRYGVNKTRYLYNIESGTSTSKDFLNSTTGTHMFILNHVM